MQDIELELAKLPPEHRLEIELQCPTRLDREAASAGLYPGKPGLVDLGNGEPVFQGNGRGIRAAGTRSNHDNVEQVAHSLKLHHSRPAR